MTGHGRNRVDRRRSWLRGNEEGSDVRTESPTTTLITEIVIPSIYRLNPARSQKRTKTDLDGHFLFII